ncbi:MAG: hypothetical protein GY745_04665 [Actinomycetia bacterium]|nr:hypothetical protein [Actinomycetes bacterium]
MDSSVEGLLHAPSCPELPRPVNVQLADGAHIAFAHRALVEHGLERVDLLTFDAPDQHLSPPGLYG